MSVVFVAISAVLVAMSVVLVEIFEAFVVISAAFVAMSVALAAMSALSSKEDRSAEKLVAPSLTVTSLVPPLKLTPVMSSSAVLST